MIKECRFPVGYLIAVCDSFPKESGSWDQSWGTYCGVDRLAPLIIPNHPFWHQFPFSEEKIASILKEAEDFLLDCTDESFFVEGELCKRIVTSLDSQQRIFELLFCEVVVDTPSRPMQFLETKEVPQVAFTYGYDVSWSNCKHSAIFQPTVKTSLLELIKDQPLIKYWERQVPKQDLNKFGLFDRYLEARQLRDRYMSEREPEQMFVFLVHSVKLNTI